MSHVQPRQINPAPKQQPGISLSPRNPPNMLTAQNRNLYYITDIKLFFPAAVKRLHASKVEFVPSTASNMISGYPIAGIAELLSGGVPPRALCGNFDIIFGSRAFLAPISRAPKGGGMRDYAGRAHRRTVLSLWSLA